MPRAPFGAWSFDPVLRGGGIEAWASLEFPARVLGRRHRAWANLCLRCRFARTRHASLGLPSLPSSPIPFCASKASKPGAVFCAFSFHPVLRLRRLVPRASLCSIPFRVSAPASRLVDRTSRQREHRRGSFVARSADRAMVRRSGTVGRKRARGVESDLGAPFSLAPCGLRTPRATLDAPGVPAGGRAPSKDHSKTTRRSRSGGAPGFHAKEDQCRT